MRRRLVVVGNGTARIRAVEEVLERGLQSHDVEVTVVHSLGGRDAVPADLVVVTAGSRPQVDVARWAGSRWSEPSRSTTRCGSRTRLGIERLRKVLVEDSDGVATDPDAGIQEAVDAHSDPWAEREEPVTAGQFRTSLPLVSLPLVPSRPAGAPGGTQPAGAQPAGAQA